MVFSPSVRTSEDSKPRKIRGVPPHEGQASRPEAEGRTSTKANQVGRPQREVQEANGRAPTEANQLGRPPHQHTALRDPKPPVGGAAPKHHDSQG